VVAPLPGNYVVAVLARHKAHQQWLQHAFLAYGLGEFAQVPDGFARLVRVRTNLVDRNHPAHRRSAIAR